jgi:hypothetical protein
MRGGGKDELPEAVDSEGHEVVHGVVRRCYATEDSSDWV